MLASTIIKTVVCLYIYFFAFLVKKTSGILFFGPSFRKPARKASSGEIYLKTRIYMLQTCKHDTTKLIFQKVLIF